MDTRWKNKRKVYSKIFIGSFLRQIILMIIMSIVALIFSFNLFVNKGINKIEDNRTILQGSLIEEAKYLNSQIYTSTDYFQRLREEKLRDRQLYQRQLYEKYSNYPHIKFLIMDNKEGFIYTNDSYIMSNKVNYEEYIKNNSYSYYKADNDKNLSPFILASPSNKDKLKLGGEFTEYYWYDSKEVINRDYVENFILGPNRTNRNELIFVMLWFIVFITFIIKKYKWINEVGKEKVKEELKNSNLYVLATKSDRVVKDTIKQFKVSGMMKKVIIGSLTTVVFVLAIVVFIGYKSGSSLRILSIAYIIFYIGTVPVHVAKKIFYFNHILQYTREISKGNFSLDLEDSEEDMDLSDLAKSINSIKEGYKSALEERVKNERLKTELISNVSHDLKTPLTSIITYVDLLQQKTTTEEEKVEYIKILDSKAKKLKLLIEDLFEASKINSGKVQLNRSNIDVVGLIYQVLGEQSGCYGDKNITFKVKAPEDEVIANLDGKQMCRVFENLISNALKYSMENTRVYIDIKEEKEELVISFKNISAYELGFDAEELFERFKRGDESRNSQVEGSGLGLAIAKTIVELHGGRMNIEIEGDLFKVFIFLRDI